MALPQGGTRGEAAGQPADRWGALRESLDSGWALSRPAAEFSACAYRNLMRRDIAAGRAHGGPSGGGQAAGRAPSPPTSRRAQGPVGPLRRRPAVRGARRVVSLGGAASYRLPRTRALAPVRCVVNDRAEPGLTSPQTDLDGCRTSPAPTAASRARRACRTGRARTRRAGPAACPPARPAPRSRPRAPARRPPRRRRGRA
jgi:hypothetical protein